MGAVLVPRDFRRTGKSKPIKADRLSLVASVWEAVMVGDGHWWAAEWRMLLLTSEVEPLVMSMKYSKVVKAKFLARQARLLCD